MNILVLITCVVSFYSHYYIQDYLMKAYNSYNSKNFITGEIEESTFTYDKLLEIHSKVQDDFSQVRETVFFKNLKVNFDGDCKFHTQNMICQFPSCGICQCEDHEIPLPWKQEESILDLIDKKLDDSFYKWVEKYNVSTQNWIWESEIESKTGIYVNLMKNIEAYTGYQGRHIWNAIYSENCFADKLQEICKEEQILFKIISGLHSNINIHLSYNYYEYKTIESVFNPKFKNITMLNERVINHRYRLNNLFFLYGILLKTFYKAEKYINEVAISTMNHTDDTVAKRRLKSIYSTLSKYEDDLTVTDHIVLKLKNYQNLDQIKLRFRNISEIIDCVSCQKCKLHGKLQIYGLATMFKVLFEDKKPNGNQLKRNEIISFVNLVDKVGRSIHHLLEMTEKSYEPLWLTLATKFFISGFLAYFFLMLNYVAYKLG